MDSPLALALRKAAREMGISEKVLLLWNDQLQSPLMLGFFRPVLVLPRRDYGREELDFILRHELTHWRRRDLLWKVLALAANALHWFNPLVWLMARRAAEDLESACDRSVIKGQSREFVEEYAQALLETAKCLLQRKKVRQTVLVSYLSSGAQRLKERLVELFQPTRREGGPLIILLALLAVLGIYIV